MGINRRRADREEAQKREMARRLKDEACEAGRVEASLIIETFNDRLSAGGRLLFSPTLHAAAIGGYRWLTIYCPGCNTETDVDLAAIDRHPDASLNEPDPGAVLPDLSPACAVCQAAPGLTRGGA